MDVGFFAELYGAELVVESGGDRAGFAIFGDDVLLAGVDVVDATDGRSYGSSATRGGFLHFVEFFNGNVSLFDGNVEVASELHEAAVGDRGEDGFGCGGDVDAVFDGKEVGGAAFVEVFLLFGVEVEYGRVSEFVGVFAGNHSSGVVATGFESSGAFWCDTVVFAHDADVGGLETGLEVWPYGGNEDDEEVFGGGFYAYGGSHSNLEGTNVERSTCAVRRDEASVEADGFFNHIAEELFGDGNHADAFCGVDDASGVVFHSENANFAVLTTESFEAFEYFLSVVERSSGHVYVDIWRFGNFNFAPFTVAICAANIVVGREVAKRELAPINLFCHDLNLNLEIVVQM